MSNREETEERIYWDSEENECTLSQMVEREPEWAANRIRTAERLEAEAHQTQIDKISLEKDLSDIALLRSALAAKERETEEAEAKRWADRLDWLHTEYGADCSGTDSGDLLDLVETEIRQALKSVERETVKECEKVIRTLLSDKELPDNPYKWACLDAVDAICAHFGLEE